MALFERNLLNDDVRGRERCSAGRCMTSQTPVIRPLYLTAVFNAYFVGVVARWRQLGTLAWTATVSVSALLVMMTSPAIGA